MTRLRSRPGGGKQEIHGEKRKAPGENGGSPRRLKKFRQERETTGQSIKFPGRAIENKQIKSNL
jgi:hypothetical protein